MAVRPGHRQEQGTACMPGSGRTGPVGLGMALSDALTEYRTHRASVRTAAQAVGMSPPQYRALEQGAPHRQAPTGDTPAPAH